MTVPASSSASTPRERSQVARLVPAGFDPDEPAEEIRVVARFADHVDTETTFEGSAEVRGRDDLTVRVRDACRTSKM